MHVVNIEAFSMTTLPRTTLQSQELVSGLLRTVDDMQFDLLRFSTCIICLPLRLRLISSHRVSRYGRRR